MRWYKMKAFKLSNHIDSNKVFILNSSELEGRLDVDYYKPSIRKLEKIIRKKSAKKLGNYAIKMASGATPAVTEEDKYYTTKEHGVPFLRVQNLTTSGQLDLTNVRYINYETHEKYLKRSQVEEGDLLVKITGVGRMAIASVAPKNFIGNTNQHMVVIKTGDTFLSEYLANYLNLDSIEKLASRRSTGGTRPALDYPALRSIPIIENIDFSLIKKAEDEKQRKQQQAQSLLASIDDYLLKELGIMLPEQDNSIEKRIFTISFNKLSGRKLSPIYYINNSDYVSSRYNFFSLDSVSYMYQPRTITQHQMKNNGRYKVYGANGHIGYFDQYNHEDSQVLVTCRGATCGEVNLSEPKSWITGNAMVIQIKTSNLLKKYLYEILKLLNLTLVITGSAQPQITRENLKKFMIPIPDLQKQQEIVNHIEQIRNQAKQLQQEAEQVLIEAKAKVEKMILGEKI